MTFSRVVGVVAGCGGIFLIVTGCVSFRDAYWDRRAGYTLEHRQPYSDAYPWFVLGAALIGLAFWL
jgi:hypothetical protein